MTDKVFKCDNVELVVKDREKLTSLEDKNFEENLEMLTGWETDLYKLYEVDPTEVITLHFPTEGFIEVTRSLGRSTDKFIEIFCDMMDSLLNDELKKRHIDLDKLHYGLEAEKGIEYEYAHISNEDYVHLLRNYKDQWYKIMCVVPYKQVHRDIFFVPQSRIHEFFSEGIYECYNGKNRVIVHIEPITAEDAKQELERIKETIEKYEKAKFRTY